MQEILPFIAATRHNLYTVDFKIFLQDMDKLKKESPDDFRQLENGYGVNRRTNKFYD